MAEHTVAVVGMGYVGVPLAMHFAKHYPIIGFDINEKQIAALQEGRDPTEEIGDDAVKAMNATFTTDPNHLSEADIIIIAVPTPVDPKNQPDATALRNASKTVGEHMRKGTLVVYESTVFPGLTEEICIPILEKASGMTCDEDFSVGYSPERVNPGDKVHGIDSVIKIVSASNPEALEQVKELYGKIVTAGLHVADSIKVAEAAKIVENTQRDMNIAIVNELMRIFEHLGIDTHKVLDAAGTKWNFHRYTPGLVGGHCIGVDPYYLIYEARRKGIEPSLLVAGREVNDTAHEVYAEKTAKALKAAGIDIKGSTIAVLGITFKENCSDTRNSKARQLIADFKERGATVYGFDPRVTPEEIGAFGAIPKELEELSSLELDAIVVVVPHTEFQDLALDAPVIINVKNPRADQNVNG